MADNGQNHSVQQNRIPTGYFITSDTIFYNGRKFKIRYMFENRFHDLKQFYAKDKQENYYCFVFSGDRFMSVSTV